MLKFIGITLLTLSVAGCSNFSPYAGLSVHSENLDSPEIDLSTGLGIVGGEYTQEEWGDFRLFCEHVSGLSTSEIGAGLNHCGIKVR